MLNTRTKVLRPKGIKHKIKIKDLWITFDETFHEKCIKSLLAIEEFTLSKIYHDKMQ